MNTHTPRSVRPWRRSVTGFALAVLLSVFTAACGARATYSTRAAGHSITARIAGNTRSIETLRDSAIIRGAGGVVTIERERIRIEGNPWTAIPEGADVEVTIRAGRVRVVAAHVTIERTVSG